MEDFILFLFIAIFVSILVGNIFYRINNILGFFSFIVVFFGILMFAIFGFPFQEIISG